MWVNVDMGDSKAIWITMVGSCWLDVYYSCTVWTVLLQWSLSTDRSDCPHWFMTEPPHASGSEAANVL